MKKIIASVATVCSIALIISLAVFFRASSLDLPFENAFQQGFQGYTSDEGEILTPDYVSSKPIPVSSGETVWFGPCEPAQYFHLVGLDRNGNAVTDKIRSKELTVSDSFENGTVIYQYTVPSGVAKLVFSAPREYAEVYAVSKTEISNITWRAYWNQLGKSADDYVGQSSYYQLTAGDKLYFGAITRASALESSVYDAAGSKIGTISEADLTLVESFGGAFGVYCYTAPKENTPAYVHIAYDADYEQYYTCLKNPSGSDAAIVDNMLTTFGIPRPAGSTVTALAGKSALFVGDSITFGARDRQNIYASGGWAGRIGYFAGMDVTNNGVSGACISTSRITSSGADHYIYNNLVAAKDSKFDFVIMHGMFNDASDNVPLGTAQGAAAFDPSKADVTTFAGALELLFYTAKQQHPEAILGYIVNFKTERAVNDAPYAALAVQICKDWGIQYLDLYNRADFSVEFDDGLHPSSKGYDGIYCNVANWMATLQNGTAGKTYDTGTTAKVMSYNIFWNGVDAVSDSVTVSDRVAKIQGLIKGEDPDILLLQEVGTNWASAIRNFASDNGYSYYGYCHSRGHKAEHTLTNMAGSDEMTPILWKTSMYDLKDSGHFWLSNTPSAVGSADWDDGSHSDYPRCVNWVILENKETKAQLLVMNVHMDPNDERVRNLSAQLLADKLAEIRQTHGDLAAIIGGDWNMAVNSTAYKTIASNNFGDVRLRAADTTTSGSYNAWTRTSGYSFGDYLFMADGMKAVRYEVVNDYDEVSKAHLSDHSPIQMEIAY